MNNRSDYVYFVRGDEHAAMARQSIQSVMRAVSLPRIYVAHEEDQRPDVGYGILRHQVPAGLPIQLAKAEAQARHVLNAEDGRLVIFIDTDTLVLRDIEQAEPLLGTADLFVTWRDNVAKGPNGEKLQGIAAAMPYNAGVWGLRVSRTARELAVWIRERVRLRQFQAQETAWYADQIALAELCGPAPDTGKHLVQTQIPWLPHAHGNTAHILKLPCETWNYTPAAAGEDTAGRGVLHFKGHSRPLLDGYARELGVAE